MAPIIKTAINGYINHSWVSYYGTNYPPESTNDPWTATVGGISYINNNGNWLQQYNPPLVNGVPAFTNSSSATEYYLNGNNDISFVQGGTHGNNYWYQGYSDTAVDAFPVADAVWEPLIPGVGPLGWYTFVLDTSGSAYIANNLTVTNNLIVKGTITGNGTGLTNTSATAVTGIRNSYVYGATTSTNTFSYIVPAGVTNSYAFFGKLTALAISLDVAQPKLFWTDETGTPQALSLGTSISGTGYNNLPYTTILAKGGTAIFMSNLLTTATGSISYNVEAHLVGISSTQ
jgi:hypothetical protein